ncbi:hypothetical protein EDD86DRAFT_204302 [Gorgonomyces haynaldii]|nr:hypothetical protein EDD86DRAFT_204302 [Gorgonomyces haynaldii]
MDSILSFVNQVQVDPLNALASHPNLIAVVLLIVCLPWFYGVIRDILEEPELPSDDQNPKVVDEADAYRQDAINAPVAEQVWTIGISGRSCSVAEQGTVRLIELTKDLKKPTVEHCVATLLKAIVNPGYNEKVFDKHKPDFAVVLKTQVLAQKQLDDFIERMAVFGVRVYTEDQVDKTPELSKKYRVTVEEPAPGPVKFNPQPDRGCYVCKKDIAGKASQCSACKAIIYCSPDCAKKDWPQHKNICANLKKDMDHIKEWKLHDLPFDYYNNKTQLHNYNQVPFLASKNLHNVGLFRRLCGCFNNLGWGVLSGQMIAHFQQTQPTPEGMFEVTGLPKDLFPLSKPFDEKVDKTKIRSWKDYMEKRGYPLDSPAPLVLEVPLTIWHIINKFYMPKAPKLKDGERRQITIHLLGPEKEADLLPLFEALLPFFPKTDLCIHMVGPNIAQDIPPQNRAMLLKSTANDSSIFISINPGIYSPEHHSAAAFKLPAEFPKELLVGQNFGQEKPDLVIAMNAALLQYQEWAPTLKFMIEQDATLYVTERMENMAHGVASNIHMLGGKLTVPVEANPFKQPVLDFKKDVNLPGWSNGFLFALGKQ